ncbi:MAG: DsbC family protein [Gammaproteobacteria bacterium]|nr:DsbC family protein [Gammaproteobacteria bacterium]
MTAKILFVAAACLVSMTSALAADNNPDKAKMTELLKSRLGNAAVAEVVETPAEGIYQTRFQTRTGTNFAYLTGDGRYVIVGDLIDLQAQVNLTELSRRGLAKQQLDSLSVDDLSVFPAVNETKTVINIFTDTSCPYCQKLHSEVPELQKAGIEVRYIPFPRGGARGPGYQALKQVWCAEDKAKSMDIAKGVATGELPAADCSQASFVDQGYVIGNQVGITGTPAIFTESGQKLDGYVPYQQLIPMLLSTAK